MIFSQGAHSRGRHARRGPGRGLRAGTGRHSLPASAGHRDLASPPSVPLVPVAATIQLPAAGPYDLAQAPAGVTRWDLGSLKIPALPGVQLRIQAGQDGTVRRAILLEGRSALHLVAFAAPRTDPIWHEIREELRASLVAQQAEVQDAVGELGPELRARVPVTGGYKLLRLAGVDGPRWLVRADFHGPAALDADAAGQLNACLRGLVVDRGSEPRPVREPLPLRLSEAMAAQIQGQAGEPPRARPSPGRT